MSNEFELSPANQELERALGGLKPASTPLNRDRLMFRAGQASARQKQVFWPALSGGLSILLAISWMVPLQPPSRWLERSDIHEAKFNAPKVNHEERASGKERWITRRDEPARDDFQMSRYVQLLNGVLRRGLDGLPREHSDNQPGIVESWRPYKSAATDFAETQL